MIKKLSTILIALTAFAFFAVPAKAQMTDDAVTTYVQEALAAGKSQQTILTELASRGVTKAQAERIKQNIQQTRSASAKSSFANPVDRTRKVSTEANSPVILDAIMTDMAKALVDSTEVLVDSVVVFGRNIFTNKNLTFAPNENIATPENYKLGPGDEVIVDIWGANQNTIRQTIAPDGFINIDGVGLVYLTGMTVKQADAYMRRQLNKIYSLDGEDAQSEIKLTLGAIRTIQVNVMGEVAVPGTYFLSSLSNAYNALYRAGGFSELGSLRNIELIRDGKKKAVIDVYDFIVKGQSPDDITLQDGDIIIVPTYEALVQVSGNVKRPMFYEMKEGETVKDLLGYAGGFMGNAYKKNLKMIRKNGREYQVYTVLESQYPTFSVMDGDAVEVGEMIDRYENRIEVKGAVYRPGVYQLCDQIRTVRQLIEVADGLKPEAFTNRALIQRERPNLTLETIAIDLNKLVSGEAEDVELKPNDVLTVSSIHELQDFGYVTVEGHVANPGSYVYADNTSLEDMIILAGGLLDAASTAKIDVSRRIKNRDALVSTDTLSRVYTFELNDGFIINDGNEFILEPYDVVYVRKSPSYNAQYHVQVSGEVLFPGRYALAHKNSRLSDLIKQAGGVSQWAYVKGARLSRKMTPEEKTRVQSTLDVLDNTKDSLDVNKLNISDSYFVGIDLEAALANPGGDADIILREDDVLLVPEYLNVVKISGNVLYPNVVTYDPGMKVKDYVNMAGGYGFQAKKNRAYIVYINGNVAKARKLKKGVVQPGCEIIIPQRLQKEGSIERMLSIASTSSSIATMLATVYNIIK